MELHGKRLALLGLGVENRALAAWLAQHGHVFTVCDSDTELATADLPWRAAMADCRLGTAALQNLEDFDVIFRSPGIPLKRPQLIAARGAGVRLSSGIEVFIDHCQRPVIGVTGTKGKGTTASLLMAICESARISARIGGNIGTPPLSFLDELQDDELVVLELSSFQLQELGRSPWGAVLLPIATDHLDYHSTRDEYIEAKGEICRHQGPGDWTLAAANCAASQQLARSSTSRQLSFDGGAPINGDGCWASEGEIWWRNDGPDVVVAQRADVHIRGEHNVTNACAAVASALLVGASPEAIPDGLRAFKGLPHRLEIVAERGGILFVNDSLATTPEAAAAGLRAWPDRAVVLIAGGASKGALYTLLGQAVADDAAALVTLGEEGPAIAQAARAAGFHGTMHEDCATMAEAVQVATKAAAPGDVVLLSPACASFGMFASYAERGDAFRRAVQQGV